jgi:hypothetical protein
MVTKRSRKPETEPPGDAHEGNGTTEVAAEAPVNGTKNAPPAFKVGPIPTAKGECVSGCVWEREYNTPDGRTYKVHSIAVEARYFHEKEGVWKAGHGFRASQLAALEFVLRRCADFVFSQRDPQQRPKEEKVEEALPI